MTESADGLSAADDYSCARPTLVYMRLPQDPFTVRDALAGAICLLITGVPMGFYIWFIVEFALASG